MYSSRRIITSKKQSRPHKEYKEWPILPSKLSSSTLGTENWFFLQKSPPAPSPPYATHVTQILNYSSQITLPRPQSILLTSRKMGKIWRESRNTMPKARHTIQTEPNQSFDK